MYFSDRFEVSPDLINEYGAVDISLICDTPLFVDPMLIFNSKNKEYEDLHRKIIKYFHFLALKAKEGLSKDEISVWFNFNEVPNNWLGYSLDGNKGLALGKKYATFLSENIDFVLNTNNISKDKHIEKVMLIHEGSGKDKISDLTVNLIKGYLCEYTERFAKNFISGKFTKSFLVDKANFNYLTESFEPKHYTLPYVINEKNKKEYVLLTPIDILRADEPSINSKDFGDKYDVIISSIENMHLRAYVNNYISQAVKEYEDSHNKKRKISDATYKKIEREAFEQIAQDKPELYDYYIRIREKESETIRAESFNETDSELRKFYDSSRVLIEEFFKRYSEPSRANSLEESIERIRFFKHIIEDCDGYKCLYNDGKRISNENDLQRLFRFAWFGTEYKVDAEPNNGRGQADFIISKGSSNQNIIEFKLASNRKLQNVFKQVKIYEKANCSDGSIIVIFYFTQEELIATKEMIKEENKEMHIDKSIFLVDCRSDNKESASKVQ